MTQDGRGSQKKAWKAFQANYDDVFALSSRLCSYCLTDQMVNALLTMTEYLKWPTRWVSAAGDVDPDLIDAFASQLEYRLMNGCCDENLPIQWQYTAAGVLQQSLDGGQTFVDAPLYDPRVYSVKFPPMPGDDGDDKKCTAAAGAAALVKEQVGDQLTDSMARYTLSQLITDWVGTLIQSSNPFLALVTVIANQIFALVIATLRPALTDTVYDQFKCIFYCNMGDDATINDAQWTAIRAAITAQIGGIAGIFLEHLVYLLGTAGCTNLVRAGGVAEGDCSDCDCDPCEDGCTVDWTFFGVVDVVKINDCHYTMTVDTSLGHFAFTSGNLADGCYFNNSYGFSYAWSSWGVGSAGINNVDPRTNPIWNFDTGNIPDETMLDVRFQTVPF